METSSHKALIDHLKRTGFLKIERVAQVMLLVDRGNYCTNRPYLDTPRPIGYGATISAPKVHALALELLNDYLIEGANVLDVGSGSGYLTACMGILVGKTGKVTGIDHIPELVHFSWDNIRRDRPLLLSSGTVKLVIGDGRLGWIEEGPYDAIHVGAAVEKLPVPLVEQLKEGGRMVLPMGPDGYQQMQIIDKDYDGNLKKKEHVRVAFVPLTDRKKQWPFGHVAL